MKTGDAASAFSPRSLFTAYTVTGWSAVTSGCRMPDAPVFHPETGKMPTPEAFLKGDGATGNDRERNARGGWSPPLG